jgi:hypothetical protein
VTRARHPHLHPLQASLGVRLPEGVLAVEAYYDSKEVWPSESLERRKALFG